MASSSAMEVDALDVTQQIEAHKAKYKAVEVERPIPVEYDLGNLAAFDHNVLDFEALAKRKEAYLKDNSRDVVQLLVNHIFNLPTESDQDGYFALLPKPVTVLPREKPVPKPKPPTRWEKFAQAKGIEKKKKIRVEWDDAKGDYTPRYGYKGAADKKMDNWLIEVPDHVDPMTDMYEVMKEDKKGKLEKNRKREKRNREEAAVAVPGGLPSLSARVGTGQSAAGLLPGRQGKELRKAELERSLALSKKSTASLGRFDKEIKGEPKVKKGKKTVPDATMIDLKKEKEASKDILRKVVGKISRGEPLVNVRKAAAIEERSNRGRPREDAGRDKGKGKGKRPLPRAGGQGGPPAKKARK